MNIISAQRIINAISHPADIVMYLSRNGYLKWVPDKTYLEIVYALRMHKRLKLKTPETFSEKIQWLKLNDRDPKYHEMVDKRTAKDYVAKRVGKEYIIPTLAIWRSIDDIDLAKLPNQFVLKVNHDSGGVIICPDKASFNLEKAKRELRKHFFKNGYWYGREWPYKDISPCIIAEELLVNESIGRYDGDIPDYKFYCFHGEPKYCQVICDRHQKETIDFFDMEWVHQPFVGLHDCSNATKEIPCPESFEEMKRVARLLSQDCKFLRVDFYYINKKVYFGELTLYPASGFGSFRPEVWNRRLGDMIRL